MFLNILFVLLRLSTNPTIWFTIRAEIFEVTAEQGAAPLTNWYNLAEAAYCYIVNVDEV
jgi:hypothetical protein